MYIEVQGDTQEALERAIKEFTRRVKKEGVLNDLRRYEFFVAPSKKRRLKRNEAKKRRIQDAREARKARNRPDQQIFEAEFSKM